MALIDDLDPIFADCLGESDRLILDKPWVRRGYVYATNGAIVVRQPTLLCETAHRGPQAWPLVDEMEPSGKTIQLPDIGPELIDRLICETCKGKDSTTTCSECNGTGKHICPKCKHEQGCRTCEGEGQQCCSGCDGEGMTTRTRQSVKLAPDHQIGLADFYIWLLQRNGITTVRKATGNANGFRFRKGKIEGLVLGMTLSN